MELAVLLSGVDSCEVGDYWVLALYQAACLPLGAGFLVTITASYTAFLLQATIQLRL